MIPTPQQLRRKQTLVGFALPPQIEEDPFPLSRRISYTRLQTILPPPGEDTIALPIQRESRHEVRPLRDGLVALAFVMLVTALIVAVAL